MRRSVAPWLVASVVVFVGTEALAAPKCPPGQRPGLSGCHDSTAGMRASPVAPVAVAPKSSKPKAPTPELRPAPLLEKADRRLLVEEIARLERLVATMSKKAPDRARIVLRLGDDYAELAKMAEREAIPPPRTIRF